MNERIEKLAFEAGLKWKAQPPHYTNTNNPIDFPVSANRDLEKFAELIVRECAGVAEGLSKLYPEKVAFDVGYTMGTARAAKVIKEHFGVE